MLIAQISDTHIVEKDKQWLDEPSTKTDERLLRVITYLNQLNPQPDLVLMTGDVSENGSEASYIHFKELISALKMPLFLIPGNHDFRVHIRKVFADQKYLPTRDFLHYEINEYPIRLIGLDTLVEDEPYGLLCIERLNWLKKSLAVSSKPTLIFMHHPPAKTGTKLFDQILCQVPSDFEDLIRESKQVLGIISGHYHHLCMTHYGSKFCFMAPSVAPVHYFAHPDDEQVTALELEDPAVTLHKWNGCSLMSHVVRVREKFHRIDWKKLKQI